MLADFNAKVYALVAQIPQGKVGTYGQLAALIATPRAARQVGFALHATPPGMNIPWQRVVNSKGQITISNQLGGKNEQIILLRQEGVHVLEKNGIYQIDLEKYLHNW